MRPEWQLQQAKAEFSKVLERCQTEGPQVVTKHGVAAAVILSMRDYEALRENRKSFKEFLRSAPAELVGKLVRGVELLGPGPKRRRLERWLAELRTSFRDRLLPVDEPAAALWGIYSARAKESGTALHAVDGLLAATAVRHALSVVTRNARDFRSVGVTVIDPWT